VPTPTRERLGGCFKFVFYGYLLLFAVFRRRFILVACVPVGVLSALSKGFGNPAGDFLRLSDINGNTATDIFPVAQTLFMYVAVPVIASDLSFDGKYTNSFYICNTFGGIFFRNFLRSRYYRKNISAEVLRGTANLLTYFRSKNLMTLL